MGSVFYNARRSAVWLEAIECRSHRMGIFCDLRKVILIAKLQFYRNLKVLTCKGFLKLELTFQLCFQNISNAVEEDAKIKL